MGAQEIASVMIPLVLLKPHTATARGQCDANTNVLKPSCGFGRLSLCHPYVRGAVKDLKCEKVSIVEPAYHNP